MVFDVDERYHTDDGQALSKEEYEKWVRVVCKDKNTQLIIIEVTANLNNVNLKIDSAVAKNTEDLLKQYDDVFKKISDDDKKALLKAEEILTQAELAKQHGK